MKKTIVFLLIFSNCFAGIVKKNIIFTFDDLKKVAQKKEHNSIFKFLCVVKRLEKENKIPLIPNELKLTIISFLPEYMARQQLIFNILKIGSKKDQETLLRNLDLVVLRDAFYYESTKTGLSQVRYDELEHLIEREITLRSQLRKKQNASLKKNNLHKKFSTRRFNSLIPPF